MSMALGVARLIDDAAGLLGRASSQLAGGNATSARHLLSTASRTLVRAGDQAHPALGYGAGATSIMNTARARADAARVLLGAGDTQGPAQLINSARYAIDILLPG